MLSNLFFAKFLKILTTGSLEIGTFLLKQSVSIFRLFFFSFKVHYRYERPKISFDELLAGSSLKYEKRFSGT